MGLNSSDIPVVAKSVPFTVSADQLETAAKILRAEESNAEVYDGEHMLLAVRVQKYDPYKRTTSLIRRDGLIVHEVGGD